jgi:type I restriction enzyme R subunit
MIQHSGLVNQLAKVDELLGSDRKPIISEHQDELVNREQTYGANQKPEDY